MVEQIDSKAGAIVKRDGSDVIAIVRSTAERSGLPPAILKGCLH